jgi:gliding motility-associated-like protein
MGKVNQKLIAVFCLLLITAMVNKSSAQFNQGNCPDNIDFEFGDFTNWMGYTGIVNSSGIIDVPTNGIVNGRHTMLPNISVPDRDYYGDFPTLCPNGSGHSIKLGNQSGGHQAERLTYTFTIPASQSVFSVTYYYAVVLQDFDHLAFEKPSFKTRVTDLTTNQVLACSSPEFVVNANLPGFTQSPRSPAGATVYYKDWTPVTIDLNGMNGRTIQIEFTTNDCVYQQHFGYAYIDVDATCLSPIKGFGYCTGAPSATLSAPFGYKDYTWWNQDYTLQYGTGSSLTISPAPPAGTVINLDIVPYPGFGCRDTLSVTLEAQVAPPIPTGPILVEYCQYSPTVPLLATPLPGYFTQWYTDPVGGTPLGAPPSPASNVLGSVEYYVAQKSVGGCEGPRKKVTVTTLSSPQPNFTINDTIQCIVGNSFTFTSTTAIVNASSTYTWDFGDNTGTSGATANKIYTLPNTYTVSLTVRTNGCTDIKQIPVTIVPRPTANFTVGNACQGTDFTFTNATSGGSIQNVYNWDFGGGVTSTETNPILSLNNYGTITVKLSVNEGTCTHDTTKQVIIYPKPTASFDIANGCTTDSIAVQNNSFVPTGTITNWLWEFEGGQTSGLQNPKVKFPDFGPKTVKLTATTSFGCKDDSLRTINVFEQPIARFKRIDTACLNSNVSFADDSYFASGAAYTDINSIWWNAGNGNTYTGNSVTTQYNTANQNYVVQQVVKSTNGCVSDTNKIAVNVLPLPIAQLNISNPLCELRAIDFNDVSSPNIESRTWVLANSFNSPQKAFTYFGLNNGLQNVKLTVKDSFGCRSLVKDTTISVNRRPKLAYFYFDSCYDKLVPFVAVDLDGNYITQWKWNFNGIDINGNSAVNYKFPTPGSKVINVYGIAANGCLSDTVTQQMKVYYVPANAGLDKVVAPNQPVQLLATGGTNYDWSPGVGLSSLNISNPISKVANDQLYTVKVYDSILGCTGYDDVLVKVYKGPELYIPTIFTPNNDGKNDVFAPFPVGVKEIRELNIFDRFGKIVYKHQNNPKGWDGTVAGKIADAGTYVWVCTWVDYLGKTYIQKGTVVLAR